ncbi:hypothetical protein GCM10023339_08290 [Alloalcanivorax gelatiniphagus]
MHVPRALALALVVPLLLAGCSDDVPTPKLPDPTTSSPTSEPTETATAEPESAEDFIRRWSDALRDMQASGQTEAFRNLGPNCESCIKTADRVEEIYGGGGAIEWKGWTILSISPNGAAENQFRVVEKSAPTRYRESASAPWKQLDGGRAPHVFELEPSGDSWVVVRTAELAG